MAHIEDSEIVKLLKEPENLRKAFELIVQKYTSLRFNSTEYSVSGNETDAGFFGEQLGEHFVTYAVARGGVKISVFHFVRVVPPFVVGDEHSFICPHSEYMRARRHRTQEKGIYYCGVLKRKSRNIFCYS